MQSETFRESATQPNTKPVHTGKGFARARLCLLLTAAVAVLVVVILAWPSAQPTLRGKSVDQWFEDPTLSYVHLHKGMPGGPGGMPDDGIKAIVELNGEAVPYLARTAKRTPRYWTDRYEKLYKGLPGTLKMILPVGRSAAEYRRRQDRALTLLGTIAYWDSQPHPWPVRHIKGEDEIALDAVRVCLRDRDPGIRSTAAAAAACMHEKAAVLIPELIRLTSDPGAAYEAINALGTFGTAASNAVPVLHRMLGKSGDTLNPHIVRVLGEIGPPAAPVLSSLVPILDSKDDWAARAGALAIFGIGTTPPEALPGLMRLTNASVIIQARQCAALALWNFDRNNPEFVNCVSNQLGEQPSLGLYHVLAGKLDRSASNLVPSLLTLTNKFNPQSSKALMDVVAKIQRP